MLAHPEPNTSGAGQGRHVIKYRAVIHEIGPMVAEFLPHGILIFFGEMAPAELREVSLIHNGTRLESPIVAGDVLAFSALTGAVQEQGKQMQYRVTAVGEMANANLAELGHLVVHFDGATTPNLPGTISVEPSLSELPEVGTTFELFGLENNEL